ncbi:MAG TPA: hypothetical protein VGR26_02335 [Acidimicrobiales bacterium]|nr:hypothetical protein [Acidimicrobiales bacterium]
MDRKRRHWSPTTRRVAFFGTLAVLIVLIQTPVLQWLLTVVYTSEEAAARADEVRRNTPGFLIVLLVGFYLDVVRAGIDRDETNRQLSAIEESGNAVVANLRREIEGLSDVVTREPLERTSERDLVREGLARKVGQRSPSVENLVTTVLGREGTSHIDGCVVNHTLRDVPGEQDFFEVLRCQTARIPLSRYVVALTASDVANEWIAYDCPYVFDTWHVASREALKRNIELHLENTEVSYLDTSRDFTRRRTVKLAEVPRSNWDDLLGSDYDDYADDLALLAVDIPPTIDPIMIKTLTQLPRTVNYCFWQADCPTFLEHVTFDVRNLITEIPDLQFTLVPFMGCTSDIVRGSRESNFEVRPHNWIVRGQGAVLTWASSAVTGDGLR